MPLPFTIPNNRNRANPNQDEGGTYDGSTNPRFGGGWFTRQRNRKNEPEDNSSDAGDISARSNPIPPREAVTGDGNPVFGDESNDQLVNQVFNKHTLDDYQSTKYNIELSLLGDTENIETSVETLKSIDDKYFIASSDISGADESYGENVNDVHFFIKSLNFKTINSLSISNPETPNTAMFNMVIEEPYGFSLDKKIRQAGNSLGYPDGWPANRFIFKLDIWFSGYKDDGTFVAEIPVVNPYPNISVERQYDENQTITVPEAPVFTDVVTGQYTTETRFSYFVHIIQIESELSNGTSTNYKLQMLPVQDIAMYSEYDLLNAFWWGTESTTFGDYINQLEQGLNDFYTWYPDISPIAQSVTGIPLRTYRFVVPEELQDAEFDFLSEDTDSDDDDGDNSQARIGSQSRSIRSDVFEKILQTEVGRSGILLNIYPREIYTVRSVIDYSNSTNDHMDYWGDLTGIEVVYYIEKKTDYRYQPDSLGTRSFWEIDAVTRRNQIISSGALKKIYKYVFSGDNTVVKNFNLTANVFWHQLNSSALNEHNYNSSIESINEGLNTTNQPVYNLFNQETIDRTRDQIEGRTSLYQDEHIFPSRRTMNNVNIRPFLSSTSVDTQESNEALQQRATYQEQLENSLRLNSLTLENLEIRGEPQWLANVYSLDETVVSSNTNSVVSNALATDIIYLKLLYPDQREYMNPDADITSPILLSANYGGFFQVVSVEHSFEGGLFTQKFEGHRLSNEVSINTRGNETGG